jgi:hypothetical protein
MKDPRIKKVKKLKRGRYADGSPFDDIQYLECKLILKPDVFTSPKGFQKIRQACRGCGKGARHQIRYPQGGRHQTANSRS